MVELIPQPALQHYELPAKPSDPNVSAAHPSGYYKGLLLGFPFAWVVCAIIFGVLVAYQLWGISRGGRHVSDNLFSVFYKVHGPSHILLQGVSCALAILPLTELIAIAWIPTNLRFVAGSDFQIVIAIAVISWIAMLGALIRRGWKHDSRHAVAAAACFLVAWAISLGLYYIAFNVGKAGMTDRVPLFYRMAHITEGVSPLLPTLLITFGFYLWIWQAMAGNILLTTGCPTLPELQDVPEPHLSNWRKHYYRFIGYTAGTKGTASKFLSKDSFRISQELGRRIIKIANPFCVSYRVIFVPAFLLIAALVCFFNSQSPPLLSLEGRNFDRVINGVLLLAFLLVAAEASRLYSTWISLRKLLHALARLRLRRALCRLRPISARSIWSVSGNARRFQYSLFAQQLDAAHRLMLLAESADCRVKPDNYDCLMGLQEYGKKFTSDAESEIGTGARWNEAIELKGKQARDMRSVLADAVAEVYAFFQSEWKRERTSLNLDCNAPEGNGGTDAIPLSHEPAVCAAEEFVSYHYIAFIQNIAARMRTMTLSMIFLFVAACFAISFYPFVPRTEITVWMVLNLFFIGAAVTYVYAGMERNEILSYIASTKPGQLGAEFWLKLAGFLVVPLIGVLTTEFPSITDTVLQWLQPGLDAIK